MEGVKFKPSTRKSEPKQGNYIDAFVKKMFSRVLVFADFLAHYADPKFVAEVDLAKVQPAPTHYIGQKGDERIVDLVFQYPLKSGTSSLMAVIIFEHQSKSLKEIPQKLLRYISAIWDAEAKESKPLSASHLSVLFTAVLPTTADCQSAANLLHFDREPVFTGFDTVHGKLYGLSKKVLQVRDCGMKVGDFNLLLVFCGI